MSPTTQDNDGPDEPMCIVTVAYPTHDQALSAYRLAQGNLPGCWYVRPLDDGTGELTSITRSGDDRSIVARSRPILDGVDVFLEDEVAQGLAQLADVGLSRNFIDDSPITVVALDQTIVVGTRKAHGRKVGRNEPCPCGKRPARKFKRCCGDTGARR